MFGEEKVTKKDFDRIIAQFNRDLDCLTHQVKTKANSPEMMSVSNHSQIEVRIDIEKILQELYTIKFPSKYEVGKEYNKVFISEMRLRKSSYPGIMNTVVESNFKRIYEVIDKHRNKVRVELSEEDLTVLIESNK